MSDAPPIGEQLVRRATDLVAEGRIVDAAPLLRQAADLHRKAGRAVDESRCLTLLAQCHRLLGDPGAAATEVERARRRAGDDDRAWLAATAELAEVRVALGDLDTAAVALGEAIERCRTVDADGRVLEAALLHRRALVLGGLGHHADTAADLAASHALLVALGRDDEARRLLVERATALHHAGDRAGYERARDEARAALADDRALAGELSLLEGAVAVTESDLEAAVRHTLEARQDALASRSPTTYVGAAVALAELRDLQGDRVAAYEALAVGWVTLGDLVGREGAASVFEPRLQELRGRWGDAAFGTAKDAYEQRRREELARST